MTRSPQAEAPAVDVRSLHKSYHVRGATQVEAVHGVELRIPRGEVVALLGPNGAGKTTLLDMFLGFTSPTRGSVTVLGQDPASAIAAGRVSSVMQTGGLLPRLSVGETLEMVADLFGRKQDVLAVARRAGIDELLHRRVSKCSGGEQQRLRFALALLPDPDVLLLDEPTTGLDVEARRAFWAAIREDTERGRTVVFATHYLAEADAIADRIVLLAAGRIVADGTPAQIKGDALGRRVRVVLPVGSGPPDEELRFLPGVREVSRQGDCLTFISHDSDGLARYLLTATPARDLEVTSDALEDAFVALTTKDL